MLSRSTPDHDDRGMTLTELVVSMTLLGIVAALALNFFVGMSAQASRVTAQTLDGGVARTAVNQIATVLRLADTPTAQPGYATARFVYPPGQTQLSGAEVVFFANTSARLNTATRVPPTKIDIKLAASVLTEYSYAPLRTDYSPNYDSDKDGRLDQFRWDLNYPTTPTSSLVLARGVSNTTVFTYCSAATDPSSACTAPTTPEAVALVQVAITLAPLNGNAAQAAQAAVAVTGAVS